MEKEYITFFHHSSDWIEVFYPQSEKRPLFYWFGNCYFNLYGACNHQEYFYLFVKNPRKDNIAFRARHEEQGFDGLYRHYLDYAKEQKIISAKGAPKYNEPAILMSFCKIIPDLTLMYVPDNKIYVVVSPIKYAGTKINLHDEKDKPRNFLDIPEILEIIPNIKNSHPFINVMENDGKYKYADWIPMITEKMGTWL